MYPLDEKFGAKSIRLDDAFTATNDVVNYAPVLRPVGAVAPDREARIAALLPTLPESIKKYVTPSAAPNNNGIVVAPDSAAEERQRNFDLYGTGLPKEIQTSVKGHRAALAEADKYLAVAGHVQSLRSDIESKLDSADFLKDFAQLRYDSPTFETESAKLMAKYPRASGAMVQDALSSVGNARTNYLQAIAPGAADEFAEGSPERDAYVKRFHQTKDPRAARAHATNVQKGEEMIKTAVANGLLDPDQDFPAWDGDEKSRPKVYNQDGSINYHEVGLLAAKKAAVYGKSAKAEDREEQQDLQTIRAYSDPSVIEANPDLKTIYNAAVKRQSAREATRAGTAPTSSGARKYTQF